MSTRMQQRRGTVATWSSANPILAPGEIGFEIDTNKFKIGDGVNRWDNLTYFTADAAAAIQDLLDGAPGVLDTLNELAASLGDNPDFIGTMTTELAAKAPLNSPTFTGTVAGVTKSMVGLGNVDNTSDANKPVSTATQTALDAKATITALSNHELDTMSVHGIDDTAALATKTYADNAASGAAGAVTASSLGLGNVDNTSDTDKPVSTAVQTALDLKATVDDSALTGTTTAETLQVSGDLTVDGDFTVSGTTTTVNTQNLSVTDPMIYLGEGNTTNSVDLGIVSSFDDGTYQHTGLVRDSSDGKWKLFKGVTDQPSTTVNFAQGSLDTLAVGLVEGVAHLSGTSTAPTASLGTDTTQIATTAFVNASIADLVNLDLVLDGGGVA